MEINGLDIRGMVFFVKVTRSTCDHMNVHTCIFEFQWLRKCVIHCWVYLNDLNTLLMLDYSYEYLNGVKIPGCLPSSLLSSNKGIGRNFRQTKTRDLGFTEEKWN